MPTSDIACAGAKITALSGLLDVTPHVAVSLLSVQALAAGNLDMLRFWKAVAEHLRGNAPFFLGAPA